MRSFIEDTMQRREVKSCYAPKNLFRLNANIKPTTWTRGYLETASAEVNCDCMAPFTVYMMGCLRRATPEEEYMRFQPIAGLVLLAACASERPVGPDPFRPTRYLVERIGINKTPSPIWGLRILDSAFLSPYAVGRPIDQRLLNDRTGRGQTGGNTRDTTIARGQFIDKRYISGELDSTIVDVTIMDTVVIISRPHPDPTRVRADTGWFLDNKLVLPTTIDYRMNWSWHVAGLERCPPPPMQYVNLPCEYRTELVYRLN
jgi:hypothetical protein